ncbi:MAG: manganese efflux pump MntP family protein [Verrucomicrobia bacterium]|nr:manganese efflux pump MntP family protein [Verrucomicrobiota bacterium]MCG2681104.1 manganese efflux pump MntP family protein [Kiritimatiellia bacterium]MBU4248213.1 manganese efflux pump MntP family protein [Verrucomicrobiota bacterium]MBU4292327.1 manganese efflux pump MntP family protein [Verrucomicrobiota bacterium]MBU4428622.1 manganese efflux pump MntP family protein [Verrucomicrobiota bacterium]
MNLILIFLIAVGLSMDALAVAIASGLAVRRMRLQQALRVAIFFGLFQALMPMLGWLAGLSLRALISGVDHWVAFGLLVLIGGKMIVESFRLKDVNPDAGSMSLSMLLLLSVATSIDALAVGLSLAVLKVLIVGPALLIGVVTFVLSLLGGLIGSRVGHCFEAKIEALGGLILVGIGVKILIDHIR